MLQKYHKEEVWEMIGCRLFPSILVKDRYAV